MTGQRILNLIIKTMTVTTVIICFLHTMTNWQSWNIWENSLHILQEVKERGWVNITAIIFPTTPITVCNCYMCTCPSGVWLWPESSGRWRSQTPPHWGASGWSCCSDTDSHWCDSLPQCHWWTWASASATPVSGSIHKQEHSEPYTVTKSWLEKKTWNDAHLHQDHVELCNVNPLLL